MIKIKESEIMDTGIVCVYCFEVKKHYECCGENHFEKALFLDSGECYLDSEVEIVKDENKND